MTGKALAATGGATTAAAAGGGATIYYTTSQGSEGEVNKEEAGEAETLETDTGKEGIKKTTKKDSEKEALEREILTKEVDAIKSAVAYVQMMQSYNFSWSSIESNEDNWKNFNEKNICSGTLFPNLKVSEDGQTASNVSIFSEKSTDRADGCLLVNWKQAKDKDKWKGVLRIEWLIKKGNEAFLSLFVAKNSSTAGNVDVYLKSHSLRYEGEEDKEDWKVKHTKEHAASSKTTFIKESEGKYWDFNLSKENACAWNQKTPTECNFDLEDESKTDTTTKVFQWWEDEKAEEPKAFSSFSSNFQEWWDHYLKDSFNLNEITKLTGTWRPLP